MAEYGIERDPLFSRTHAYGKDLLGLHLVRYACARDWKFLDRGLIHAAAPGFLNRMAPVERYWLDAIAWVEEAHDTTIRILCLLDTGYEDMAIVASQHTRLTWQVTLARSDHGHPKGR